jgi:hypothetical protein
VIANPPLQNSFFVPAEVWVCDSNLGSGSSNQEKRITMHRYDAPFTKALAHAHDQCVTQGFSVKGAVADLLGGRFRSAGKQLAGFLKTRELYASAVLDVGAGGLTDAFSDFQLLRPAKMTKCGGDGLAVPPGSIVAPKVCVTDLAGDPVPGATVHFSTSDGSVAPLAVVTGPTGEATANWTISTTPSANSLVASGNGIATAGNDGPREAFDPFQPFPYQGPPSPESGAPSGAVNVLTGSETFTAHGLAESVDAALFDFGSSGWSAKQLSETTTAPVDWYTLTFNSSGAGFAQNLAQAFGSRGEDQAGLCSALTFGASWALGTTAANGGNDILARKLFTTASPTSVEVRVSVDNDLVEVWLNGTQLNDELLVHENCASPGTGEDFTFNATTVAGTNVIAIRARDRGSLAYLNVKIGAIP